MAATRIIKMHINKGKTISQCLADRTDYAKNPKNYNEFLASLREDGYRVVPGKHHTFSHSSQKKHIRVRSLGEGYSERDIQAALLGNRKSSSKPKKKRYEKTNLLSDIEKMINSGKGAAYENWAKKFSAKQIAKSIIFLKNTTSPTMTNLQKV